MQAPLIFPSEDGFVVFYESIHVVFDRVWRVDKDEVTLACFAKALLEVGHSQLRIRELRSSEFKIIGLKNDAILGSDGNIELTAPIQAVESVPTCAIQVE